MSGAPLPQSVQKVVHTMRMPIRWGDMDVMGHVNNTLYFRYTEQARMEWLEAAGLAVDPGGTGPVIVNAHCSFLKQLKYPGEIEISTSVGPPGRSSFEMHYEIRLVGEDGQAGAVHAVGGSKVVWVNLPLEKSVPLPDAVRSLLPAAG